MSHSLIVFSLPLQRMNALRIEADDSAAKVDELAAKVKTLEQENLSKEQEITSLQHKNQMLESEVEKLEGMHKDAKAAADESLVDLQVRARIIAK